MIVTLPWPDARLSPNARIHWRPRNKVILSAKRAAFYLAKAGGYVAPETGTVPLAITFHPPDARRRDMDNAIASLKAALDGIALAIKADDHRFTLRFAWGQPCKPGRVEIQIGEGV